MKTTAKTRMTMNMETTAIMRIKMKMKTTAITKIKKKMTATMSLKMNMKTTGMNEHPVLLGPLSASLYRKKSYLAPNFS